MTDEQPCPDCGNDPDDDTLHRGDCPRLDTVGQLGPPWVPGPWAPFCRPVPVDTGLPIIGRLPMCLQPRGHHGEHDPR